MNLGLGFLSLFRFSLFLTDLLEPRSFFGGLGFPAFPFGGSTSFSLSGRDIAVQVLRPARTIAFDRFPIGAPPRGGSCLGFLLVEANGVLGLLLVQ